MSTTKKWSLPTHKDLPCSEEEAARWNGASKSFNVPTHKDLPETDGRPMENSIQFLQIALLSAVLRPVLAALHPDGRYYVGRDVGIYYRLTDPLLDGCKAPDWFYVADVDPLLDGEYRRSYVLWNEPQTPRMIVEFVSGNSADEHDRTPLTGKLWVYENRFRTPFYVIFNDKTAELEVFNFAADQYLLVPANEFRRFPIATFGIELGVWNGTYESYTLPWLRAYRPDGTLIPTPEELVEQERTARQIAVTEKDRLAAKLRQMGVDPESV